MFSGIVSEIGKVKSIAKSGGIMTYSVETNELWKKAKIDSSIAVNGVCQSVVKIEKNKLYFDAIKTTLDKTTLSELKFNDMVNLEESLTLEKSIDGHLVQGHINSIGKVTKILKNKNNIDIEISINNGDMDYLIPEGSICINGVSLTVSKLAASSFWVSIIPLTFSMTNLNKLITGKKVNIEFDMLLRRSEKSKNNHMIELLKASGFV